jgi:ureidoacrylate peracid hydrolase
MSAAGGAGAAGGDALVLVDMQNAFLAPDGSMAAMGMDVEELRTAIPGCVRLAAEARRRGVPVVNVRICLRPDYRDGGVIFNEKAPGARELGAMVAGTRDSEFVPELAPADGDFVVEKRRFSAFYATTLESLLASLGVERLVLGGVLAGVCVESTARDAAQRDFRTLIAREATADVTAARRDDMLARLGEVFCEVGTVEEAVAGWPAPTGEAG